MAAFNNRLPTVAMGSTQPPQTDDEIVEDIQLLEMDACFTAFDKDG